MEKEGLTCETQIVCGDLVSILVYVLFTELSQDQPLSTVNQPNESSVGKIITDSVML